jgi:hypothetical protein
VPLRIVTILGRLKQDLAGELSSDAIKQACKEEKYSWRQPALDPVTAVYLFILQILHGNTACSHVVHFGQWNFTDTAYCAARKRLPLGVLRRLAERVAGRIWTSTTAQSTWHGHRVWLLDGSSFSMPETPELQAEFGQPSGQVAGSRSPSSWHCSTWPQACCCGSNRRRYGRTRCRDAPSPPPVCSPATSRWVTVAFVHTLTLPFF